MSDLKRPQTAIGKLRWLHYAIFLVAAWGIYAWLAADLLYFKQLEAWSMISGYIGFIFIGATLVVGPLKQWLPQKASSYLLLLRRDLGILGGIAAIFHVITVLIIFQQKPDFVFPEKQIIAEGWLGLFFTDPQYGGNLNMSLTGIANYMGAIAFLCLLAMWVTSSNRAQQLLGGGSWKRVHMSNLMIFILVSFHGVIYVNAIKGAPQTYSSFLWLTAGVLLVRFTVFLTTIIKRKLNVKEHEDKQKIA